MKNFFSNKFEIIIFFISPLFISLLFPRPYYDTVNYDSEPNLISNLISYYSEGFVVDYMHPDTFFIIIGSALIKIIGKFDTLENLISFLRIFFTYLNFIFIFFAFRYILKMDNYIILFFSSLILIIPNVSVFIGFISPQELLIGLGVILVSISLNLDKNTILKSIFYGIVLGIGASVKYTFIVLFFPLALSLIFKIVLKQDQLYYLKIFLLICLFFILSFFIFAFPVLPLIPIFLSIYPLSIYFPFLNELNNINLEYIFYSLLFVCIILSLIFTYSNKLIKKIQFEKLYILFSIFFLILFTIDVIYKLLIYKSLNLASIETRNSMHLITLSILFFTYPKILILIKKSKIIILFLFIFLVSYKSYNNYNDKLLATEINNYFENFINQKNLLNMEVAFFPSSTFKSKDLFIKWTDYRYGDRIKSFNLQNKNIPFDLNIRYNKFHILNYREFYFNKNEKPGLAYKYLQYLYSKKIFLFFYKDIIEQNLYITKSKNICSQPYDNYLLNTNFVIILPYLSTYITSTNYDDKLIDINEVYLISDILTDVCGYKTIIKEEYIDELQIYSIYVYT